MTKLIMFLVAIVIVVSGCGKTGVKPTNTDSWIVGSWKTYKYLDTGRSSTGAVHYDSTGGSGYYSLQFSANGTGIQDGTRPFTFNLSNHTIQLQGVSELTSIIKLSDTGLELNQHFPGKLQVGYFFRKL